MPPPRDIAHHLIDRPELRKQLDDGLSGPVALLVAPAGAGKTVLLSQWSASRTDLGFAFVDVDRADGDPVHLFAKLAGALRLADGEVPALATMLTLGGGSLGTPVLEALVPHLAARAPLIVVIDDLHRLENSGSVADLGWLIENLPDGVHVVLSSRYDPPLSLSRHRLHYAMVELRQAELAFDAATTAAVVDRIAGGSASTPTVQAILERTEGWAAGVQLTALALRSKAEPERFAMNFADSDRLVADYLSEQVLEAMTSERRALLLRMSALERMSAPLVEEVLGVQDAQSLFDDLTRESMFLIRLDGPGVWYRFHHLFRDLLLYRLRARFPLDERRIKEAAARWHLAQGDSAAAIRCLLTARSWDLSLDAILARGREVYERGQTATVAQWLSAVPADVRRARPDAETLYGILLGMSGEAAAAVDVLQAVRDRPDTPIGHRIVAQCYLATRVQFRPDAELSLRDSIEAMEMLEREPDAAIPSLLELTSRELVTTVALSAGGRACFLLGDLAGAREWLERAARSPGADYSAYRVHVLGSLALVEAWSGRTRIALALADEALNLAREVRLLVHPAPADAYLARSLASIEAGEPAGFALHEGLVRASANGRAQLTWVGIAQQAMIADAPGADAPSVAPPQVAAPPLVADRIESIAARAERLDGARPAREDAAEVEVSGWSHTRAERIAGLLGARDVAAARPAWAELARPDGTLEPLPAVQYLMLGAWLAALESRPGEANARTEEALAIAQKHDLVDVFVRLGSEAEDLIAGVTSPTTPFRRRVVQALQGAFAGGARRASPHAALGEALTDRERELLIHLPSRMSNAELAAHWFVSVNTIKTHMAHIYRKLEVANRDAAVARARELGML